MSWMNHLPYHFPPGPYQLAVIELIISLISSWLWHKYTRYLLLIRLSFVLFTVSCIPAGDFAGSVVETCIRDGMTEQKFKIGDQILVLNLL